MATQQLRTLYTGAAGIILLRNGKLTSQVKSSQILFSIILLTMKIDVIFYVVKPSDKLSVSVNVERARQVWCRACSLRSFVNFKFTWTDLFFFDYTEMLLLLRQYVIYVSVGEFKLLTKFYRRHYMYKFVSKFNLGLKNCCIRAYWSQTFTAT